MPLPACGIDPKRRRGVNQLAQKRNVRYRTSQYITAFKKSSRAARSLTSWLAEKRGAKRHDSVGLASELPRSTSRPTKRSKSFICGRATRKFQNVRPKSGQSSLNVKTKQSCTQCIGRHACTSSHSLQARIFLNTPEHRVLQCCMLSLTRNSTCSCSSCPIASFMQILLLFMQPLVTSS